MTSKRQRAERPPTNDLLRMASFAVRSGDPGEPDPDGLTLDGYAAVFNRETIIDSWEGRFKEVVDPGSMRKSFREKPPIVQFDHGTHPTIGSLPIASVRSITEDSDPVLAPEGGAHIVARLFDNWLVEPVRNAIAEGAISGMSFRFGVVRDEWRQADGTAVTGDDLYAELERTWFSDVPDDELLVRHLREVRVPELGPVVWPAYAETSVGVRGRKVTIDLATIRSDPAQRRMLAEAVLIADHVERDEERDAPLLTGHPAEQHPTQTDDSPQVTGRKAAPADEHETTAPEGVSTRPVDLVLRDFRSRLRSIPPQ
jgi:phage head maturation protease